MKFGLIYKSYKKYKIYIRILGEGIMADKIRLGDLFEKDFVSFDTQWKNKSIILGGTKKVKLGEGVFSFVHISDDELEFYDADREALIDYLATASEGEADIEMQKFIERYADLHPYLKFLDPNIANDTLFKTKHKILDILRFCLLS